MFKWIGRMHSQGKVNTSTKNFIIYGQQAMQCIHTRSSDVMNSIDYHTKLSCFHVYALPWMSNYHSFIP